MDTEIDWQKVIIVFIAVSGVAFIFFLLGRASMNQVALAPANVPAQKVVAQKTETVSDQKAPVKEDENVYKNETYGFGLRFLAEKQTLTECEYPSKYAYDPVKEYIFSEKMVDCADAVKDHEAFYAKQGGQIEALVFDTDRCNDTVTDKTEKVFCGKYGATEKKEGMAENSKWPRGYWFKSEQFLTFFTPLASQDKETLAKQYKFLIRVVE